MEKFGKVLRSLREDKGLTQRQIAEILNVRNTTVSMWEKGYNEPSQDMLIALAEFFEVSTDYLLGFED